MPFFSPTCLTNLTSASDDRITIQPFKLKEQSGKRSVPQARPRPGEYKKRNTVLYIAQVVLMDDLQLPINGHLIHSVIPPAKAGIYWVCTILRIPVSAGMARRRFDETVLELSAKPEKEI